MHSAPAGSPVVPMQQFGGVDASGAISAGRAGISAGGYGSGLGAFSLPTLSRGATPAGYGGGGLTPGAGFSRASLETPGGSTLGALAPSAAALLAQYGFSGAVPAGGVGVPSAVGSAGAGAGGYPAMNANIAALSAPLDLSKYMSKLNLGQTPTA